MFAGRVEIRETADPGRQMHLDAALLHQWQVTVFAPRVEQRRDPGPQLTPFVLRPGHEGIEMALLKDTLSADPATGFHARQVKDEVPDGHADMRVTGTLGEYAEWQVLDREITTWRIGALHPTAPRRVVGFIETRTCHAPRASAPPSSVP
jgi:hypothetical protein